MGLLFFHLRRLLSKLMVLPRLRTLPTNPKYDRLANSLRKKIGECINRQYIIKMEKNLQNQAYIYGRALHGVEIVMLLGALVR